MFIRGDYEWPHLSHIVGLMYFKYYGKLAYKNLIEE